LACLSGDELDDGIVNSSQATADGTQPETREVYGGLRWRMEGVRRDSWERRYAGTWDGVRRVDVYGTAN